jgi:hypothetical protein
MVIAGVSTGARLMDCAIDCASILVGQLRRKRADEADSLIWCQFRGHKHEPFTGDSGVAASACVFHGIPEYGAVLRPGHVGLPREVRRQNDFLVGYVATIREIVYLAGSLILDALA